jgi:hypothetical protein
MSTSRLPSGSFTCGTNDIVANSAAHCSLPTAVGTYRYCVAHAAWDCRSLR